MLKLILMELSESSPACQWVRLGDLDFPSRTSFSGPGYLATAPSQSCLDYLLRWHNGRVLQWLGVHYVIDLQVESLTAISLSFSSPQWPEMNWCDLIARCVLSSARGGLSRPGLLGQEAEGFTQNFLQLLASEKVWETGKERLLGPVLCFLLVLPGPTW